MKIQQVLNCSFSSWYESFKKVTLKSEVIQIPKEVVDYLLSDGIVLPKSAHNGCNQRQQTLTDPTDLSAGSDEDEIQWDEDDPEDNERVPHFPEFEEKVKKAIRKLGGKVFPKLNWSSPRDAAWVALNNSLMCTNLGDILLLLKSSDFVTRDLTQPFLHCDNCSESSDVQYELVLRRWLDISPSGEFRCFVKNGSVIAISQRAHSTHFPHLEASREEITTDMRHFFTDHIEGNFPDSEFVFDVYRKGQGDMKLVDFNPFGKCTDALLYTWPEIKEIATDRQENVLRTPEFRYQREDRGVQPSEFQAYAVPKDFVDLCHGEDINKLVDVMRLHENVAGSSSDEDNS